MFSIKSLVLVGVAVVFGALGATYLWPASVAASTPAGLRAPAPAPAPTQVVIREVVREVRTEPPAEKKAEPEIDDPILAQEMAAELETERLARVDAELESNFRSAAAPDRAAIQWESNLGVAFREAGSSSNEVQCRSSFCRIEASFANAASADNGLNKIFMSGPDERLPNLASTVSRTVDASGTVRVKIFLHPALAPRSLPD